MKSVHTSEEIAAIAAKVMHDPKASKEEKSLAASALAQSRTEKVTSPEIAHIAAQVLGNSHASAEMKKLAGSVLAQKAEK